MNIFDKIKSILVGGEASSGGIWEGVSVGNATQRDHYESMEKSYVVFACLDKIQKNTANIELYLQRVLSKGNVEEVYEHELLDLLYGANQFTTFRQLIGVTQLNLDLIGRAYWYKKRKQNSKKIEELWILRPDMVRVVSDGGQYISHYEYTGRGKTEKFPVEDIIPFVNPNPIDMRLGSSKITPVIDLVRTQIFSSQWNMNFFYREARPDAILNIKQRKPLTKEEKEEARNEWNRSFQGRNNTHKLAITQGEIDYKIIGENQKDMDFVNLSLSVRDNISMALGVPKPILMPEEGNKTTVEGSIYIFMSQTIKPNMQNIVDTLNEFLVPEFDRKLFFDFENPVPEDRKGEAETLTMYVNNGILTRNEAREVLGYGDIKGGDDIYIPITVVPISEAKNRGGEEKKITLTKEAKDLAEKKKQEKLYYKAIRGKSKYLKEEKEREDLIKNIAKDILSKYVEKKSPKKLKQYTAEMKKSIWEVFNKNFDTTEKLFYNMARKAISEQQKRVEGYLFKERKSKDYILKKDLSDAIEKYPWKKEISIFIDIALPLHTKTIVDAGKDAATRIGSSFDVNEEVRAYISEKTMTFATEVNETTKENLRETLSQGIEEGETMEDLRKRVNHVFDVRTSAGAMAIAMTETAASVNGGWLEAYKQSGVIEKKEWYHAGSSLNDRPEHIAMSGEVVRLEERFSNGLMFPGDPSAPPSETVNCKCIILEVIE